MAAKITKNLNSAIPPRGYMSEIADLVGCTRQTVSRHLRNLNSKGYYAERIRKIYFKKFGNQ
jgi:DNA-binding MarR family transcriptional regulator